METVVAECRAREQRVVHFLTRVNTTYDRLFPVVETQILRRVFVSLHQHDLALCEAHPQETLREATVREYVKDIDGGTLLKAVRQVVSKTALSRDVQRYLQEILDLQEVSAAKRKESVEVFPSVDDSSLEGRSAPGVDLSHSAIARKFLVVLLYVCNVPQDVLALLLGVGTTSIHTWMYTICGKEVEWQILRDIVYWSGQVSGDEKWVQIKGSW